LAARRQRGRWRRARSNASECGASACSILSLQTILKDRPAMPRLLQALPPLGWTVGRNLQIEHRWGTGNVATTRKNATELVALATGRNCHQ
jgi:hypothetical protein